MSKYRAETYPYMWWNYEPYVLTTRYNSGVICETQVKIARNGVTAEVHVFFEDGETAQWNCPYIDIYNDQFGVSVSRDGRFVFVQTWDRGLFCYDSRTGAMVWRTKRKFGITDVFVNRSTLLVHQRERALQLLDIETGEVVKEKKPARAWGFYALDCEHIICHTAARTWEIIRAEDLETVEVIPAKKFPDPEKWCVRNVFLRDGRVWYEAFEINESPLEEPLETIFPAIKENLP